MAGKFQLYNDINGTYRFTLETSSGEVVASSDLFDSKEAALDAIRAVRNNAPVAAIEDMTTESEPV